MSGPRNTEKLPPEQTEKCQKHVDALFAFLRAGGFDLLGTTYDCEKGRKFLLTIKIDEVTGWLHVV